MVWFMFERVMVPLDVVIVKVDPVGIVCLEIIVAVLLVHVSLFENDWDPLRVDVEPLVVIVKLLP